MAVKQRAKWALTPELANLAIACMFMLVVWCPLAVMFHVDGVCAFEARS
jgi:hypothetical protein